MASKAIGFLNFKFSADLSAFERAMNKAQKKLKKFGNQLQKTGKSMTMGLTVPIVGLGIASSKMSMTFDKSMTKVITLVGIAEDQVNSMRKSVLELSDKTGIAAAEMAEGLFFLTSAGLRGANALETLEAVAKASASGLGDMESLSKVAAAAQNAYGVETLTAADALDTFAGMVKSGMFEANELSQVLGGQMGLASTLGISMEELGAFIATYTKTTGDATSATTGLEGVMMSFAKITPKQEKALSKINMTVEQLRKSLSEQGLQKTLIMMASKFKDAGVDLSEFFSKSSSLKGVLGVLGNQTETYIDILDDLSGAQGTVDDAFDRTTEMAGFQITKSFNQLKNAGIEMGDALAPVILIISEKIQALAKWFSSLSDSQKESLLKWGLIAAAIGPVLIVIGKMSVGIGALIGVFKKVSIYLVANPWLGVAAAVAVLAFKIYDLVKGTEKLVSAQDDLNKLTKTAEEAIVGQKVEVELLTNELKTQALTLDDKEKALKKLQEISPKYYGSLDAATFTVESLDTATQNYTKSILQQAKMEASKQKLIELNTELMKKEEGLIYFRQEVDRKSAKFGNVYDLKKTDWYKNNKKRFEGEVANIKNRIQALGDEYGAIHQNIKANEEYTGMSWGTPGDEEPFSSLFVGTPDDDDDDKDDDADTIKRLKLSQILTKKYAETISGLGEKISDLTHVYNNATVGGDDFNTSLELITKTQEELNKAQDKTTKSQSNFSDETKALFNELTTIPPVAAAVGKSFEDLFPKEGEQKFNKISGFIDRTREDLKFLFGDLEELNDNFMDALNAVLGAFDAFKNKMRIKAENENKRKTEDIDNLYKIDKLAIENSLMSEEDKAKALEDLDQDTADAKTDLEEETQNKLAKIKKREAIRNKAMAIVDAIINTASAVVEALPNIPLAAIVAGLGAIEVGAIASTPIPLAEGGLVTGPTTALIGEAGAEAVIPLDRLKQFMSGDKIEVVGKLIGNDIYLSNRKTEFNRTRTA